VYPASSNLLPLSSVCGVCEAFGNDRRHEKAIDNNGRIARDASILGVGEHKSKMSVSSAPAHCFEGCRDL
jgi:hypothetical protein